MRNPDADGNRDRYADRNGYEHTDVHPDIDCNRHSGNRRKR
jgi:hypothetical protein